MEVDKLTLVAGIDVPIPQLKVSIHQPTIGEIAILGEEKFYSTLGIFSIGKESVVKALTLSSSENQIEQIDMVKESLETISDFEILMRVLNEGEVDSDKLRTDFENILALLFPGYFFSIEERFIMGLKGTENMSINEQTFPILKEVIEIIFCLKKTEQSEFNPIDDKARAIAEKLKRARERVRNLKGEPQEKNYILANYISSLGIGSNALNLLDAVKLTVYQLFNQMERYGLFVQSEYSMKASLAGAKGVEHIDWLKQL